MARTRSERIFATGAALDPDDAGNAYDGWGEPSIIFPEHWSFAYTGASNSKVHVAEGYGYEVTVALCGIGIVSAGAQAQTLQALVDRGGCTTCIRELERATSGARA